MEPNRTEPWLKAGPLAGYQDPLLTLGVDYSGISWFFGRHLKGHPAIYSCNRKKRGTFRSF
jgi:hypothetical protein